MYLPPIPCWTHTLPLIPASFVSLQVETAGDCYIVAGSLMRKDEQGFICLEHNGDAAQGAQKVMGFAKAILRCAKTVGG